MFPVLIPILFSVQSPPAKAPSAPPMAFLAPGCNGPTQPAEGIEYLDLGKASGGDLFLVKGYELWTWKQTDRGQRFLARLDVPPPPRSGLQLFNTPKWRNGAFWFPAGEKSVQRFDPITKRWEVQLNRPVRFEELEVTPTGQIALIGTPEHLVEIWEAGAQEPVRSIDYPKLEMSGPDRAMERGLWTQFKTAVCDEFIVIYAGVLGRVYSLDSTTYRFRELPVPWTPLQTRGIASRVAKEGGVVMIGFPQVGCIQFIPDLGLQVRAVFHVPDVEVKVSKTSRRIGPITGVPEFHWKSDDESLKQVSWSLSDGSKSETEHAGALAFPVWLDGRGDLLPLGTILERSKVKQSPGVTEGSKGKRSKPSS